MFNGALFILEKIVAALWGPATIILFLAVGVYFTLLLGIPQLFGVKQWLLAPLKTLFSRDRNKGLLCTVLAATVGTGNIVGVAAALMAGGAGAVFWMWVSAFFGMALGYAENLLGMHYRKQQKGKYYGSAAFYIEKGLKSKPLAVIFSIACALAAFGIGNLTQGNSMAGGIMAAAEGLGVSINPLFIGIAVAAISAPAILGGKDGIEKAAVRIVPAAVTVFLALSIIIICKNYKNVFSAIALIFGQAFNNKSVLGGVAGYGISTVIRTGLSRGLFSHEAGMGSSVGVHAAYEGDNPVQTGFFSMFEVFVDTIVVCTLTALVIISSGAYENIGQITDAAQLVSLAFWSVFGSAGSFLVAVLLSLFGISTILGWCCFGQTALSYVTEKDALFYKITYTAAIPLGCVLNMSICWYLSDIFNWLMAIINIFAMVMLSHEVFEISRKGKCKNGTKKGSGNT